MSPAWSYAAHCAALRSRIDSFVATLARADLAAPVPTCPGWDVAQLAAHVGATHRWVAAIVATGGFERVSYRTFAEAVPAGPPERVPWLEEGAGILVDALRGARPDQPVWVFGVQGVVAFWPRRMLHELTVHHLDLGGATGQAVIIDAAVAVDGIQEFFALAKDHPKLRAPDDTSGGTIILDPTDAASPWLLTFSPEGITSAWTDPDRVAPDARIRGSAADLYRWLWNRGGAVEVDGDAALVERWGATVQI